MSPIQLSIPVAEIFISVITFLTSLHRLFACCCVFSYCFCSFSFVGRLFLSTFLFHSHLHGRRRLWQKLCNHPEGSLASQVPRQDPASLWAWAAGSVHLPLVKLRFPDNKVSVSGETVMEPEAWPLHMQTSSQAHQTLPRASTLTFRTNQNPRARGLAGILQFDPICSCWVCLCKILEYRFLHLTKSV